MIPNYRTVQITASSNEEIVDKIYAVLKAEGYTTPNFVLKFVGFETTAGTVFHLNGKQAIVPLSGSFITPYQNEGDYLPVRSLKFNSTINNMNFWIIY